MVPRNSVYTVPVVENTKILAWKLVRGYVVIYHPITGGHKKQDYGTHKNLPVYISFFLLAVFGLGNYGPP